MKCLEFTGHPSGGVCPFGLRNWIWNLHRRFIKDYEFVYPWQVLSNCMKVKPTDIQYVVFAKWIDVSKLNEAI